jgi:AraC-like DNA-binding protein
MGNVVVVSDITRDGSWQSHASRLRPGLHSMVFHHLVGQTIERRSLPAWKIIMPIEGHLAWPGGRGSRNYAAAAVCPPQIAPATFTAAGSAEVLIDPWFLGLGPGHGRVIPLDQPTVAHLGDLWLPEVDSNPDERVRETVSLLRRQRLLPPAILIDPRVQAALRILPSADRIQPVAAAVGLSSSRLRVLIRDQTGTRPASLRMWQRLRTAIMSLLVKPIAEAAIDAGFADQAHLTRTATRFVGYTPRDLACALSSVSVPRHGDGSPLIATAA